MKVVMIGSGNVATVIGKLLLKRGHEVLQVFSRDAGHAGALAGILDCAFTNKQEELLPGADIYLTAINDTALYALEPLAAINDKLVLHTAGSVPMEVLQHISTHYGVMYPLQSLRKEMEPAEDIPMLVNGCNADVTAFIKDFAASLSGTVTEAGDAERLKLHVAAVVVSNFTNHLYAMAETFCREENVDFKVLLPLIRETAGRLGRYKPADLQTGPAVRNDMFTLDKHLRILNDHPRLRYLYLKLTESIMNK